MFVESKKKMANHTFEGHLTRLLEDPFLLLFEEPTVVIVAIDYPENTKAIGSTGRTNL